MVEVTATGPTAAFRDVPRRVHAGHPAYVPMLNAAFRRQFSKRNPFWRHARSREWIAYRDRTPVGRIGACVDESLLGRTPGTGVVGFFDCVDDAAVADALFAEALGWRTVKLSLEPPLDSDEYDYLEHIERWVAALAGSGNE